MADTAPTGLILVGCGKMGGAMLRGWLDGGVPAEDLVVVEPSRASLGDLAEVPGLTIVDSASDLPDDLHPRIVVLAVKPQAMDEAAPPYRVVVGPGCVVLSIAAGKTIDTFEDFFGKDTAVVRAMPNTPAAVGRGITAAISNANVTEDDRILCDRLLSATGEVVWLTEEGQMDVVTALSGGGPAYVFLLAECLAAAGEAAGLPEDLAMQLARVTVAGSGELLYRSEEPAAQLRQNVTSPKGTTEAALKVLMAEPGMKELMVEAIAAAAARSRELAG